MQDRMKKAERNRLRGVFTRILSIGLLMALSFIGLPGQDGKATTEGTFRDRRDGRVYQWVKLGDQIWMAENLAYLPQINGRKEYSNYDECYYVYEYAGKNRLEATDEESFAKYGVLYNLPAARKACPKGWHLPGQYEYARLGDFLQEQSAPPAETPLVASASPDLWIPVTSRPLSPEDAAACSESPVPMDLLFRAGGRYDYSAPKFRDAGARAFYWTSSTFAPGQSFFITFNRGDRQFRENHVSEMHGFSVRCIKD
jgi:uncharacterized protein (TIGR02145 family)